LIEVPPVSSWPDLAPARFRWAHALVGVFAHRQSRMFAWFGSKGVGESVAPNVGSAESWGGATVGEGEAAVASAAGSSPGFWLSQAWPDAWLRKGRSGRLAGGSGWSWAFFGTWPVGLGGRAGVQQQSTATAALQGAAHRFGSDLRTDEGCRRGLLRPDAVPSATDPRDVNGHVTARRTPAHRSSVNRPTS
jgi:hypothetical protein